jgi:hypothetical protein
VFTEVCCIGFGNLGSKDSVVGFSLPALSRNGETKFIITSARIDPPKNPFMYVTISTESTPKPTPKIDCPIYVNGVEAGSVAMKNAKKMELPINSWNAGRKSMSVSPYANAIMKPITATVTRYPSVILHLIYLRQIAKRAMPTAKTAMLEIPPIQP